MNTTIEVTVLLLVTAGFILSRLLWVAYVFFNYKRTRKRKFHVLQFDFIAFQKYLRRNGYKMEEVKPVIDSRDTTVIGVNIWVKCTGEEYEGIKARIEKKI